MKDLIYLLNSYNIPFKHSVYGYEDNSIVISNKKYQIEIYESKTDGHLVRDLQEIPYNWGMMGSTTIEEIKEELAKYFNYKFDYMQTTIFDYVGDSE